MKHEPIKPARVMTATEFKAKCLEAMDRVNAGEWSQVVITKRGKDVAVLLPPEAANEEPPWDPYSMFGAMKGTAVIPDGLDIDGPIYDPEVHGVCDPGRGLRDD